MNSSPFTSSQLRNTIEGLSAKYVYFKIKKLVEAGVLKRSLKQNNSTNGRYMYKVTTKGESFIRSTLAASLSQFQPIQAKQTPSARDLMTAAALAKAAPVAKAADLAKAAPLAPKAKKKSKPSIPSNLNKRKFPFEQPQQKRVRKYQSRRRRYRPAMNMHR
jgi:DNA-binding HxlR family transcriptional regulator